MANIDNIEDSIQELSNATISWMDSAKSAIKEVKDGKLDAPATAGTTGQVLTKTATGQAWADAPTELPSATSSDSGKVLTVDSSGSPEWAEAQGGGGDANDYLYFEAGVSDVTVHLDKVGSPDAVSLEYSTDKANWIAYTWDGNTGATITLSSVGDKVWWRGNNDHFSKDSNNYYKFVLSSTIYAHGNIMSLLDKTCESLTIPANYCFARLFLDQRYLSTVPLMPALTLKDYCYFEMYKCNYSRHTPYGSLLDAGVLPAKLLNAHCYHGMYYGQSILRPPICNADTNASNNGIYAFQDMFHGCNQMTSTMSFTVSDKLPEGICQSMYQDCNSLTVAVMPSFNALENNLMMSSNVCKYMYKDCSRITSILPEAMIVGQNLATNAFEECFANCTNLRTSFAIQAYNTSLHLGSIQSATFKKMFANCSKLTEPLRFTDTTNIYKINSQGMYEMYFNCVSLAKPMVLQWYETGAQIDGSGMYEMYKGCTKLQEGMPIYSSRLQSQALKYMYSGCTSLTTIPLLRCEYNSSNEGNSLDNMFEGCTSLNYIHKEGNMNISTYANNWLLNASATGVYDCPSGDTTTMVPSGWTVTHGANEPSTDTTSIVEATSTSIYTVCPGSKEIGIVTVSSDLTLNAGYTASTDIAYAEVVIDLATGATVTAGTNLTLVDDLTDNSRNICIVRWSEGAAKLYVTMTEDLPSSSSSASA